MRSNPHTALSAHSTTLPEIARQLVRLNDLLERLVNATENRDAKTQPDNADDR
ncbi:MAG: hypothetical protein GY725_21445 [bacterium]|nr:hypothetical protein [bacterium]